MTDAADRTDDLLPSRPQDRAADILAALGGRANIVEVEACITRLRVELRDASVVDEPALQAAGAHDVIRSGTHLQVVLGPEASGVAGGLEALL